MWVNFQMKKAMIPMAATPPATERPMMVDVDVPLLPPPLLSEAVVDVAAAEAEVGVAVTKTMLVSVWPSEFVVTISEENVVGGAVVTGWVFVGEVVVGALVLVGEVLVGLVVLVGVSVDDGVVVVVAAAVVEVGVVDVAVVDVAEVVVVLVGVAVSVADVDVAAVAVSEVVIPPRSGLSRREGCSVSCARTNAESARTAKRVPEGFSALMALALT